MYTCTFFGHRDCPTTLYPSLKSVLIELITTKHVSRFLVGNNGAFDSLVYHTLKELCEIYPHITYGIVLSRYPTNAITLPFSSRELLLPDGFESVPPRFAIDHRNRYLLKNADFVVTYVTRPFGGAAKFAQKALRQQKTVINLE